MRRAVLALIVSLLTAFTSSAILLAPANAWSGPTYQVMNADGGIFFRNSPHWDDHPTLVGYGVYPGETVQASCWLWGEGVGPYNNHIWYDVLNLTRPTVSSRSDDGWLNTHFIQDGMTADHPNPTVPQCGTAPVQPPTAPPTPNSTPVSTPVTTPVPNSGIQGGSNVIQNLSTQPIQGGGNPSNITPTPPEIPGGASVYYSPYEQHLWVPLIWNDPNTDDIWYPCGPVVFGSHLGRCVVHEPAPATKTLYSNQWQGVGGGSAGQFSDVINGKRVTTLAGWSVGRVGPLYFLHTFPSRAANIDYIILFDPGSYDELRNNDCHDVGDDNCFKGIISSELATWLKNPGHHVLVMAGGDTQNYQGINEVYFKGVHGSPKARQVMICGYGAMGHEDIWINFRHLVAQPMPSSCPTVSGGKAPQATHP